MALNPLFNYKLPQLPLVKQNFLRHRLQEKGSSVVKTVFGVWPKNFNPLWQATAPFRLPFKSFDFYIPFQRYIPFPHPTHGCFFRLQTHLFVFWYEFHLKKYSIALDLGTKEKLSFSETFLWIRRSQRQSFPFRSFWSFYQRASSFSLTSNPFFTLNSNQSSSSPYFRLPGTPAFSYWFEETLSNVRLFGWSFYSRLSSVSLNTTLSQSSFDPQTLQRSSPWSSTNLWLSSPIHDYSFFVSSLFSIKTVILPEMFFQFQKKQEFSSFFWSQLVFRFWMAPWENSTFFPRESLSSFLKNSNFLNSYFFMRLLSKLSLSFWKKSISLGSLFSLVSSSWQDSKPFYDDASRRSFSVTYRSLALPIISQQLTRSSASSASSWNSISLFPHRTLYLRYLRRHFCFSPLFVNYSITLEERILDLNFFFSFFFQSHSFNASMQFHQMLFLWFFFLSEVSSTLPNAARFAMLTPNNVTLFDKNHSLDEDTTTAEEPITSKENDSRELSLASPSEDSEEDSLLVNP